jgi:hypothetical protein
MKLGDTFVWSPGGIKERRNEHLYVAVTAPNKNTGLFVVFNLTKSKGGPKALTLKVGEHPFIKKYDGDVNFGDGLIISSLKIENEIKCGRALLSDHEVYHTVAGDGSPDGGTEGLPAGTKVGGVGGKGFRSGFCQWGWSAQSGGLDVGRTPCRPFDGVAAGDFGGAEGASELCGGEVI